MLRVTLFNLMNSIFPGILAIHLEETFNIIFLRVFAGIRPWKRAEPVEGCFINPHQPPVNILIYNTSSPTPAPSGQRGARNVARCGDCKDSLAEPYS